MSCQSEDEELVNLKKENKNLRSKLQEKEKQIERLNLVISNLKGNMEGFPLFVNYLFHIQHTYILDKKLVIASV